MILQMQQGQGSCPMCDMMSGSWGWPMMIFVGLVWLLLIVGVVWLVLRIGQSRGWLGRDAGDRAERILKERYARGDIDRETYERMVEDLRSGGKSFDE